MNRRQIITVTCASCAVPSLWYATRPERRSIAVRFWLSERAARYPSIGPRIHSYLEGSFSAVYDEVTVSAGGVLSVRSEHGYEVMRSGEWPQRIARGVTTVDGDVEPVSDVNLLVTDGDMQRAPTGAAIPNVAAVGGARYLESVSPYSEVDDVVRLSAPRRVMQTLLHEAGHALGLRHEHGSIVTTDDVIVVSPMVGSYAWATDSVSNDQFDAEECACGSIYPTDRDGERHLSFSFSECAVDRLREYNGGLFP